MTLSQLQGHLTMKKNFVFNLINVGFRDGQIDIRRRQCVGGIMYAVCNDVADVLHIDMWPTPGTKEGILVIIATLSLLG